MTTTKVPVALSYGMGVDSTAVLVGMKARSWIPDLVMFADVGSEKPETYDYIQVIRNWLNINSFPELTIVRYVPKKFKYDPYSTIEGNCISNSTLPSLAFGGKGCSMKWKGAPMDKYVLAYEPFQEYFKAGKPVERLIGYDDGPKDSKRGGTASTDPRFTWRYPLREWGWDRERCIEEIRNEGLPVPVKSACFFCPSTQKCELLALAKEHPDLALRAVLMEDKARPFLEGHMSQEGLDARYATQVAIYAKKLEQARAKGLKEPNPPKRKHVGDFGLMKGLWRGGVKGTRKPESARPGSWRTYLEQEGLMEEVERLGRPLMDTTTPTEDAETFFDHVHGECNE